MAAQNFWDNQESAQETVGRLKSVKAVVAPMTELSSAGEDLEALIEMAAEDLRLATRHLGGIVGKVDVEEILGSIFKDFCIGK